MVSTETTRRTREKNPYHKRIPSSHRFEASFSAGYLLESQNGINGNHLLKDPVNSLILNVAPNFY